MTSYVLCTTITENVCILHKKGLWLLLCAKTSPTCGGTCNILTADALGAKEYQPFNIVSTMEGNFCKKTMEGSIKKRWKGTARLLLRHVATPGCPEQAFLRGHQQRPPLPSRHDAHSEDLSLSLPVPLGRRSHHTHKNAVQLLRLVHLH